MPMYEYQCKECGHRFETLVIGSRKPVCPVCSSQELEKQFSTFGMGGGSTTGSTSFGSSCSTGGG
jgi:putative FmdB family regulatory protein